MTEYQGHHIEWGHGTGDFWQVVPLAVVDRNTPKGPPLNQWREVCRWDVEEPAFKVVDKPLEIDWKATAEYWKEQAEGYRSTFGVMDDRITELFDLSESLIAAFEELAEEHRALQAILAEGIWVGDSVEKVVMPNPSEGQVKVRPYVRAKPRRSKPVEIGADQGTVQAPFCPGDSSPSEGPTAAQQIDRLLPKSGEETPGNWYNTDLLEEVGRMGDIPGYLSAQPEERSE